MSEAHEARLTEDISLMLGRILMDGGFKDLFHHDPVRAGAVLGVTLEPTTITRIRNLLARMGAMDPDARNRFSSQLNSVERWVQM